MLFCYQNCSDLLWEEIVLAIEKNFWNSRLKAENLQNFKISIDLNSPLDSMRETYVLLKLTYL